MSLGFGNIIMNQKRTGGSAPPAVSATFLKVDTIALLRANNDYINGVNFAEVLGYTTKTDNGGGEFYYDSTSAVADDGFTTIKPTSNAGNGRWIAIFPDNVVNIKRTGATGDGVTNDYAAINKAIALGSGYTMYVPPGTFFVSAANPIFSLPDDMNIIGAGDNSILKTNINGRIIMIGERSHFFNLAFEGSGKAAGLPFQTGILLYDSINFSILNCTFKNFCGDPTANGGGGIYAASIGPANQEGGRISNCRFDNNNAGLNMYERGEYVVIDNCQMTNNTCGIVLGAGNTYITNCNVELNTTGLSMINGANDGHGNITNCSFNHNTTPISIADQGSGETFTNCSIFYGAINISNSTAIKFIGCTFDQLTAGFTLTNNTVVTRELCKLGNNGFGNPIPVNVVSGEGFTDIYSLFITGTVFQNNFQGRAVENDNIGNFTIGQTDTSANKLQVTGTGGIKITGDTTLLHTGTALADGAAAGAGTITNAPTPGNPTKWIPIDDNGTTRYIPTWLPV